GEKGDLPERDVALEWDQPLRWQANALQNRPAVANNIEQGLLHLLCNRFIADIDVDRGRELGADAGVRRVGKSLCPALDLGWCRFDSLPGADPARIQPRD